MVKKNMKIKIISVGNTKKYNAPKKIRDNGTCENK